MRLFKKNLPRKKWNSQTNAKWYCELRDHYGRIRRLALLTDKKASQEIGLRLEQLVSAKIAGIPPDISLMRWADALPVVIKQRLVDLDLLDSARLAIAEPLIEHFQDFRASLVSKGDTKAYVDLVCSRLKRILDECNFDFWPDVTGTKVQRFLDRIQDEGRGVSVRTASYFLRAINQFARFLRKEGRVKDSPLENVAVGKVSLDIRHERRPFTEKELRLLIKTARAGPARQRVSGPERALVYILAAETGLRANEIRTLTKSSFNLVADTPTVTVLAGYSKRRREDVLPLRPQTAELLREHLAMKLPTALALKVPARAYLMVKEDLEAVGIPYKDARGRYADFHSLRHTFVTNLAKSGVHPKTAQALARHSDINLTMSVYTHTVLDDQATALEGLPDLTTPEADEAKKTGTGA